MNNSKHSPEALREFKKNEAAKLGLTPRELDLNYDVYETTYGYQIGIKEEVRERAYRRRWAEERAPRW